MLVTTAAGGRRATQVRGRAGNEPSQSLKIQNHSEGPYQGLFMVESSYYHFQEFKNLLRHFADPKPVYHSVFNKFLNLNVKALNQGEDLVVVGTFSVIVYLN